MGDCKRNPGQEAQLLQVVAESRNDGVPDLDSDRWLWLCAQNRDGVPVSPMAVVPHDKQPFYSGFQHQIVT